MSFFIETSAKNGENVKDLFINAAYLLYYEYLQSESQQVSIYAYVYNYILIDY